MLAKVEWQPFLIVQFLSCSSTEALSSTDESRVKSSADDPWRHTAPHITQVDSTIF